MPWRPPIHKPLGVKTHEQLRASREDRGYDWKWRKLRESFLKSHPLCKRCEAEGFAVAAEEVHHIRPIVEAPDRRLDETNLEPICKQHHLELEGKRRYG